MPTIDLTGKTYGLLTVLGVDVVPRMVTNRSTWWLCDCACGHRLSVRGDRLRRGEKTHCDDARHPDLASSRKNLELPRHKHPLTHKYWTNMLGQKKVPVIDRWLKFDVFLHDMGERPSKDHVLIRRNQLLGYQYDNCIWGPKGDRTWALIT